MGGPKMDLSFLNRGPKMDHIYYITKIGYYRGRPLSFEREEAPKNISGLESKKNREN
jgi:hypothetical protein